jgi:L-ascorbate metabolism protein UlaG (beta-lactamase superfamily)
MSLHRLIITLATAVLAMLPLAAQAAPTTELTWYGQSAFKITTPTGKVLYLDPWLTNPVNKGGKEQLAALNKADLILVTHGHFDHVGNSAEIARKTGAKLVATFDLGKALVAYGGFPEAQFGRETGGNFGGQLTLLNGEVKVAFIPAQHSSGIEPGAESGHPSNIQFAGNPSGMVISIKNGPTIYHTGDTDLFNDMALVREYGKVDIMLTCIGDHFTMGPRRAAQAVKLVQPTVAIPMHFGTFPALTGTPQEFSAETMRVSPGTAVQVLKVGESFSWPAGNLATPANLTILR